MLRQRYDLCAGNQLEDRVIRRVFIGGIQIEDDFHIEVTTIRFHRYECIEWNRSRRVGGEIMYLLTQGTRIAVMLTNCIGLVIRSDGKSWEWVRSFSRFLGVLQQNNESAML